MITEAEINGEGEIIPGTETIITNTDPLFDNDDDEEFEGNINDDGGQPRRKYYISQGEVTIAAETVQILDANGKLRTIRFTQFAKEHITTMFSSVSDFHHKWNDLQARKHIMEELENNGISIEQLMDITKQKEVDPFDLLCFVAFDLKPLTRKQRVDLLKKNKADFFSHYTDKAKDILNMISEKYIDFGLNQIRPDIISAEPIRQSGNEIVIVNEFGGMDKYKQAIEQLQTLLYAA